MIWSQVYGHCNCVQLYICADRVLEIYILCRSLSFTLAHLYIQENGYLESHAIYNNYYYDYNNYSFGIHFIRDTNPPSLAVIIIHTFDCHNCRCKLLAAIIPQIIDNFCKSMPLSNKRHPRINAALSVHACCP